MQYASRSSVVRNLPYDSRVTPTQGVPLTPPAQHDAAPTNLGALPSLTTLAQQINALNQTAQQQANAGRIPNAGALEQQSSGNIASALAGDVPNWQQLMRKAAEGGVASGVAAAQPSQLGYFRDYLTNSMANMNQGQNWLTQAYGRNPSAPLFDVTSQLTTPSLQAQIQQAEAARRLQQEEGQASRELQRYGIDRSAQTAMSGQATQMAAAGMNAANRAPAPAPTQNFNYADLFSGGYQPAPAPTTTAWTPPATTAPTTTPTSYGGHEDWEWYYGLNGADWSNPYYYDDNAWGYGANGGDWGSWNSGFDPYSYGNDDYWM